MLIAPTEPNALKALGTVNLTPETYGVDVMWFTGDKAPVPGQRWGVQRKELKDLLASVDDGRLSKEIIQMRALDQGILIIEGKIQYTTSGELVVPFTRSRNRWTRDGLRGLVLSVQGKGVWVLFTESVADTVRTVEYLVTWCEKEHHSIERRGGVQSVWGKDGAGDEDWGVYVLQSVPGVGLKLGRSIYRHFNGLPLRLTVSRAELQEVEGIGPKKAEAIHRLFLNEDGSAQVGDAQVADGRSRGGAMGRPGTGSGARDTRVTRGGNTPALGPADLGPRPEGGPAPRARKKRALGDGEAGARRPRRKLRRL